MKTGIAAWHYHHRTLIQNVEYFISQGHDSISIAGYQLSKLLDDEGAGDRLAAVIKKSDITLSVHHKLPINHSGEAVSEYKTDVDKFAAWQEKHGCLYILSFDVANLIRDDVSGYIEYALVKLNGTKIALEDFGLNQSERAQIEKFKDNQRFGYLVDIGHMYIRIKGESQSKLTLFKNSPDECPACENPSLNEFVGAFKSKEFPIFEIHLHNNDGIQDLHYFLEDGTLDIKMIAKVIKEIGFGGILTIESAPGFKFACSGAEADTRINNTYDYWISLIK